MEEIIIIAKSKTSEFVRALIVLQEAREFFDTSFSFAGNSSIKMRHYKERGSYSFTYNEIPFLVVVPRESVLLTDLEEAEALKFLDKAIFEIKDLARRERWSDNRRTGETLRGVRKYLSQEF